jgi:hypothetical protein
LDAGINARADQHRYPDERVGQSAASDSDAPAAADWRADQCAHKSASPNSDAHADMDGYIAPDRNADALYIGGRHRQLSAGGKSAVSEWCLIEDYSMTLIKGKNIGFYVLFADRNFL